MRNILLACAVAFFAVACWGQTQDNPTQNDVGPQTILVPVCPKANQVPDYTAPWTARITRCTTHQPPDFTAARKAGITGWGAWVVVQPTIDQNGNVVSVEVVSGEPTLAKAAIEAVRQWKFEWVEMKRYYYCKVDASSLPCAAERAWLAQVIYSKGHVLEQNRPTIKFWANGGVTGLPENPLTFFRPDFS